MDDTFRVSRQKYDDCRNKLIENRYKQPGDIARAQEVWEVYDDRVYLLTNYFSLLPKFNACVMEAAWELASYEFVIEGRLGPTDQMQVKVWAIKLWERINEKCSIVVTHDLVAWSQYTLCLWSGIDNSLPSSRSQSKSSHSDSSMTEKELLENAAVGYFLPQFNAHHDTDYTIKSQQGQERPDVLLQNAKGDIIGLEITHVYYDDQEAKRILGRSDINCPGSHSQPFEALLDVVRERIQSKADLASSYDFCYPIYLLVRIASPIFGWSNFNNALQTGKIQCSETPFTEVWLLVFDDADPQKYKALKM